MFQDCSIESIPEDYPKSNPENFLPWNEFAECVGYCIKLKDDYNFDVTKIIKNELLENSQTGSIYHACSLASLVLHFKKLGCEVETPEESRNQSNYDLKIIFNNSAFECELKTRKGERSISPEAWSNNDSKLLTQEVIDSTSSFIRDRSIKAFKQATTVFADMSFTTFANLDKINPGTFPSIDEQMLKEHRLILFSRKLTKFAAFFIDFDPIFLKTIQECTSMFQRGVYPPTST